jgi:hypothetical protein
LELHLQDHQGPVGSLQLDTAGELGEQAANACGLDSIIAKHHPSKDPGQHRKAPTKVSRSRVEVEERFGEDHTMDFRR